MLTRLSILVRALADDQKSADARLRRVSTRSKAYEVGQPFTIVRVPQPLMLGMCDVGHVSVLVQNHDGTLASMGFYSRSYRRGLSGSLITRDDGILVSPDPLYARASRDPALRPLVVPIYRGALTEEQWLRFMGSDGDGADDDGGSGGASAIAVSVRATGLTEATCERAVSFRGSVPRASRSTQGCALSCGVP